MFILTLDGHHPQTETEETPESDITPEATPQENTNNDDKKQVIFPEDPLTFNPKGLTRGFAEGTKNGDFYYWNNLLGQTIFRWDEDYKYGSHYHISDELYNKVHFYPGTPVPEPYATKYFE